jgi:hypothetical protein
MKVGKVLLSIRDKQIEITSTGLTQKPGFFYPISLFQFELKNKKPGFLSEFA